MPGFGRSARPAPDSSRSTSLRSPSAGSQQRSLQEIKEGPSETPEEGVEEKVYVAVRKEVSEGKANVLWVLQNTDPNVQVVIVHVHRPAKMIPTRLGLFLASQLPEAEVEAYRHEERREMNESLDKYFDLCTPEQERCEKLVIEMDEVGKGLVELINQRRITKLVMGVAEDNHYSNDATIRRFQRWPRKAKMVRSKGNPSCEIWFVCKGNLICIREAGANSLSWKSEEAHGSMGSSPKPKGESSQGSSCSLSLTLDSEYEGYSQSLFSHRGSEDRGTDDETYEQLQLALLEARNKALEAYMESCRRNRAERDLNEAKQKIKALQNSYDKERKEKEERFPKLALELDELRKQSAEEKIELEQLHREKALWEHEQVTTGTHTTVNLSQFSYSELQQATLNFDDLLKIGEGGYGNVYKGFLRHTTVAIKMLNPQGVLGKEEFHQEVDVHSRMRHPNVATLIGACPEAWALVYEFLHNGSLEDRLSCKEGTPPLSWQVRTRIANEICSALVFLHSHQPEIVVHGDLKPANILLDANFVSKLGDFGICRLLARSNTTSTNFRQTQPKGTLVYMDPVFFTTGKLTTRSDVYSFGIILLRLLTGLPASNIANEVKLAMQKGCFHEILDASAGSWPVEDSHQLAELALRCCDPQRKNRPDLAGEAWKVSKPMMNATTSMGSSSSFR